MTTATVIRRARFGALMHAEWTKIRSVRSTAWSLGILVVSAIGLNTVITAAGMASWKTLSAATKQGYLADPTGFLSFALNFAQIPICVLGAMVISSEYSTGMIRASMLAVPRRTPMLAAKATVFAAVAFVVGELVAFASFLSAQAIIRSHIPVSLSENHVYLDVMLNGKGPYHFIFDTGGANIVDPAVAKEIGAFGKGSVQGSGVGSATENFSFANVAKLQEPARDRDRTRKRARRAFRLLRHAAADCVHDRRHSGGVRDRYRRARHD